MVDFPAGATYLFLLQSF